MPYHAEVVFTSGFDFLFKSSLGHCEMTIVSFEWVSWFLVKRFAFKNTDSLLDKKETFSSSHMKWSMIGFVKLGTAGSRRYQKSDRFQIFIFNGSVQ